MMPTRDVKFKCLDCGKKFDGKASYGRDVGSKYSFAK